MDRSDVKAVDMTTNEIRIAKKDAIEILLDLNFLVVSIDRIGSAQVSDQVRKDAFYSFAIDGDVFKRLATIRYLIDIAFSVSASPSEIVEYEAAVERLEVWRYSKLKPRDES
jgi:hypothetical protein